ncbi:MAG: TonB-dependent receptor [Alphaproteobacteria bacterium]|nr:TonB-dependent receptor [Alphaproteobacteria bacterium]
MTKTRVRLASGAAILALSAGAAMAQEGVEQVVVSSTRLQSAGFDAPTPTTVISAADLEAQAKPSVFEAITQLPALQGSSGEGYNTGSTTTGLIGLSSLGLRGLSPLRTLVLLDSQRVVGGNFNGAVDVSQMPQMLIQRVDVVTGGASASWGSDAVAGVINFVTDKKFEGFKANAQTGLSNYGDMGQVLFQMAAGTSFAGGRGHFEIAGEYAYNDGLLPRYPVAQQHSAQPNIGGRTIARQSGQASYAADTGASAAPPGQARNQYFSLVQGTQSSAYGLIQAGTPYAFTTFDQQGKAIAYDLAGTCFKGPGGTLQGALNGTCIGTPQDPGNQNDAHQFTQGLYDPLTRGDLYARVSYDLTPSTEIYATFNYGVSRTENIPAQGNSSKNGMNAHCDNPYLLQSGLFNSISQCLTNVTPGFNQGLAQNAPGTANFNNAAQQANIPYGSDWANIPTDQLMFLHRQMRRYVVGGDGNFDLFGKSWNWETYFQHGETDTSIKIYNMPLSGAPFIPGTNTTSNSASRFNQAQDAVFNASGQIVCRNAVAQAFGCMPFNPFGGTSLTPGQVAYFDNQNGPGGTTLGPSAIQTVRQEAFSFSVNGSPIDDWAGPVAVAAGYEYREEHYSERADPYSGGVTRSTPATVNEPCQDPFIDCGLNTTAPQGLGAWNAGNYHNGVGTYHVNEVFLEVGIPLLNDQFWGKMDLDIAGRHARYNAQNGIGGLGINPANGVPVLPGLAGELPGTDANTWKVGITWDTPIPGVRVRALQSRDIRAPNLSELFTPPAGLNGSVNNEFCTQNGGSAALCNGQQVRQLNIGNGNLKPEKAQTTEVGIVWQPDFLPGFQASVDYYRIAVKGAIIALSPQQSEQQCFLSATQGLTSGASFCNQATIATANGVGLSLAADGRLGSPNALQAVASQVFNFAALTTDGFDLEASYTFDLQDYDVPGTFNFRSLATHTSKFINDSGIPGTQRNVELAGALGGGGNSNSYNSNFNVLNWKLQETQSYQNDIWGINLTERWYSGGVFANRNAVVCAPGTCPNSGITAGYNPIQSPTYNFDKVSSILYLDIGANWNVSDKTNLYAKVDNAANIRPPDTGGQNANNGLYDVIGRLYRVGVRFSN